MALADRLEVIVYGPRRNMDTPGSNIDRRDRVLGCFLGGAVGDALGAPLEFRNTKDIFAEFGPTGLRDFIPWHGTLGGITDDTQLMLFTAEALLRTRVMGHGYRSYYPPTILRNAYRRWLMTQRQEGPPPDHLDTARGWLLDVPGLWVQRSPDRVSIQSLKKNKLGTPEEAINDGKGFGAIARVAPAGMFKQDDPFRLGAEVAAITHGHPTATCSAGYFAVIIYHLMHGTTIRAGVEAAVRRSAPILGQTETMETALYAVQRADEVRFAGIDPTWYDVEHFGNGTMAHEAMAIAIYCAMSHPEPTQESFEKAVALAANHNGNSDTTAALTGQLLGTMHGMSVIPPRWLERLELRDVITEMAEDMAKEHVVGPEWKQRYPPL
jgi:ADP-ribosylglycohydrolase